MNSVRIFALCAFVATIVEVSPTITSVTLASGLSTYLALAGLATLKVAGGLALTRGARGRRSVEFTSNEIEQEYLFKKLDALEQFSCLRRVMCEVGTGQVPGSDYDALAKDLLSKKIEEYEGSYQLDFIHATRFGSSTKSIESCRERYFCPKTLEKELEMN